MVATELMDNAILPSDGSVGPGKRKISASNTEDTWVRWLRRTARTCAEAMPHSCWNFCQEGRCLMSDWLREVDFIFETVKKGIQV